MKNSNPKNKFTLDNLAGMVKKGFDSVDKRFDVVDKRFEKTASKEDVTDLTNRVISVEEKIETLATKKDINNLRNSVDKYMELGQRYYQEMIALTAKVDRLEKWINQIADKIGIELKS